MHASTLFLSLLAGAASALPGDLHLKRAVTSSTKLPAALRLAVAATASPSSTCTSTSTVMLSASGSVVIPSLSAMVPLATATAAVVAGKVSSAQVMLTPMGGSGPGVCAAQGTSTFTDSVGNSYTLGCNRDMPFQGDLGSIMGISWGGCIEACRSVWLCQAVAYNRVTSSCYFKNLYSVGDVTFNFDPDNDFASVGDTLEEKVTVWSGPSPTASNPTSTAAISGPVSTSVISASGVMSLPGVTACGTIADATVTLMASSTVSVKLNIRWR